MLFAKQRRRLVLRIPWDPGYTFGDVCDKFYSLDTIVLFLPNMERYTLCHADSSRTQQLIARRWIELRSTVFTMKKGEELFAQAEHQLWTGGALGRDLALWGNAKAYLWVSHYRTPDMPTTLEFMALRLAFLDEHMAEHIPADREAFDVLPK